MTLPESISPGGSPTTADPDHDDSESRHQWDINDNILPTIHDVDDYRDWPNGHCKAVYTEGSEEARRHASGWAMRNTNNHKVEILKKSCLGVLVCSQRCSLDSGDTVHLRPAICDKARRKQLGKSCPNPNCSGHLELQPCRGHCGYPVTHFWRHVDGVVFFQAKGIHDHSRPELKSSADGRRCSPRDNRSLGYERARIARKRMSPDSVSSQELYPHKLQHMDDPEFTNPMVSNEMICSCPPFECLCGAGTPRSLVFHHQTILSSVTSPGPLVYHVPEPTNRHHAPGERPTSDYVRRRRDSYLALDACGRDAQRRVAEVSFSKSCSEFTSSFIPCMSPGEPLKVDATLPNCMYDGGERRGSSGHNFYLSPSQMAANGGGACYESKTEPGLYGTSSEAVVSSCTLSDFEMTNAAGLLDPSLARGQPDVLLRLSTVGDELDCALLNLPSITPFLDDGDACKTSAESAKSDTSRSGRYYVDSAAKSDRQPCDALTGTRPVASPPSLVELKPMASCKKSRDPAAGTRPTPGGDGSGGGLLRQFGSAYVSDAAYQHLMNPSGKSLHTDYFETYGFYRDDVRPYAKGNTASGLQNHSINITVSYS